MNINSCSELQYRMKRKIGNDSNHCMSLSRTTQRLVHTQNHKARARPSKEALWNPPMPTSRMLGMLIPPDLFDPLSPQSLCVRHFQHRAASWVGMSLKGHGEEFTARLLGRPGLFRSNKSLAFLVSEGAAFLRSFLYLRHAKQKHSPRCYYLAVISVICRRQGLPGQRLAVVHGWFLGRGVGRVDDHRSLRAAAVFAAGRLVAFAASIPVGSRRHKGEPSHLVCGKKMADKCDEVFWKFPYWLLQLKLLLLALCFLQLTAFRFQIIIIYFK